MTNTNFSLGVKRLPYSRMLKSEMADYVEKTIAIVQDHDLQSVMIDPVFNLLLAKVPDVKLLRLSYGIDLERLKANKLKADMMLQISAFKLKVRLLNRSNLALDLHVVHNVINSHLMYLNKCRNDKELNQKISGFLDLNDTDLTLLTAIEEYNLTESVDAIRYAHAAVNHAWQTRVELLSQRADIPTRAITKGMTKALGSLFKAVETAHLLSTLAEGEEAGVQIDYVPLIDELNQLTEMFNRSISIRDANNKRKAELEKERNPQRAYALDWTDESTTRADDDNTTHEQDATMKNTFDEYGKRDDDQEETAELS